MPSFPPSWHSKPFLALRLLQCILSAGAVSMSYDLKTSSPGMSVLPPPLRQHAPHTVLTHCRPSMCIFTIACLTLKHFAYDLWLIYTGNPTRPGKTVLDESVLFTMWTGALVTLWYMYGVGSLSDCDHIKPGSFPQSAEICRAFKKEFRVMVLETYAPPVVF